MYNSGACSSVYIVNKIEEEYVLDRSSYSFSYFSFTNIICLVVCCK